MQRKTVYIADDQLKDAVSVAVELELPLLVTGEPGTGKTQLAYWLAEQHKTQVLRFNTKTTSTAKDLFYRYDAIRHFRDARGDKEANPLDYVTFEALGKAILAGGKKPFVVLIDEIDKAPRDFMNDVLFEFEEMAFRVEEATDHDFARLPDDYWAKKPELKAFNLAAQLPTDGVLRLPKGTPRPILVLTSNSEKNLPDAFLRRCAYYNIKFPDASVLKRILKENIRPEPDQATLSKLMRDEQMLDKIIERFEKIRQKGMRKSPATAELVRWVEILGRRGITDVDTPTEKLLATYAVLAKNNDDLEKMRNG